VQASLRTDVLACRRACVEECSICMRASVQSSLRASVLLGTVFPCLRAIVLAFRRAFLQAFLGACVLPCRHPCVQACLGKCVFACRIAGVQSCVRASVLAFIDA
jgi:hypothetical protein